ncbi:Hypothetical predicted protein [Lynx pardinus]|uniref:Uncharacterized protein n=1 Tax=Lynx pardinus TaxID=191816 RepID=A0A485MPW6_LYNPA|nr:Hypothetical predicted protein [Lynx pardinus]
MDLRTLSGLGAKRWYFTAATASQTSCGKQEGDSLLGWRHSWAEQDLLQTTTRETESIWFNRCPSRQAPEELAANPAMLEASSAAQPISDITGEKLIYIMQ